MFFSEWKTALCRVESVSGRGRNKLRTYTTFKEEFTVEQYCCMILSLQRAAICTFGGGVAPIRIETGRYEHWSVDERKCPFCYNVEDEVHVLFNCHHYEDMGLELIEKATILEPNFTILSDLFFFTPCFTANVIYSVISISNRFLGLLLNVWFQKL